MTLRILVRGGGDLASGVIVRLHRAGWQVLVTELERPLAVRRYVAFAQAVYAEDMRVEEVRARKVQDIRGAEAALAEGSVPVLVDPEAAAREVFHPHVLVDGRMRKLPPENEMDMAPLTIGLGPGFTAGFHCHAVIETNRGPHLGQAIWQGGAEENTGIPERVGEYRSDRVLRSPVDGSIDPLVDIGTLVQAGAVIARVAGQPVTAPFPGVLRGLAQAGLPVSAGEKIGDLDPRADPSLCWLVSDKALAVGGGVLEAILSWRPLRGWR
jgi:xanthine dehydrogenase accessory factor